MRTPRAVCFSACLAEKKSAPYVLQQGGLNEYADSEIERGAQGHKKDEPRPLRLRKYGRLLVDLCDE
jgi:hypothetical protein